MDIVVRFGSMKFNFNKLILLVLFYIINKSSDF